MNNRSSHECLAASVSPDQCPLAQFAVRPWHLAAAGALIAGLYLACVNGVWTPTPDSALYMGLGRSIAQGQGFQFNGLPNNHVTPGFPLLIAAIQGARPAADGCVGINLAVTLLGLAGGAMIYLSLGLLVSRRMALAATVCTMLSCTYFGYSHIVLTDIPFVPFAYGALYCCLRAIRGSAWWTLGAAVAAAAGLTFRMPGVSILLPLALALALDRQAGATARRRLRVAAALLAATVLTAGLWYLVGKAVAHNVPYAISVTTYLHRLWGNPGARLWSSLVRFCEVMAQIATGQNMAPLGAAMALLMGVGMASLWRRGGRFFAIAALTPAVVLMVVHRPQPLDRYLIPVTPLLFCALIEGLLACTVAVWRLAQKRLTASLQTAPGAADASAPKHAKPPSAWALLVVATVFTAVVVIANVCSQFGDLWKQIVAARSDNYIQKDMAEVLPVVGVLRSNNDGQASTITDRRTAGILYYLGGKPLATFPPSERVSAQEAEEDFRQFMDSGDLRMAVVWRKGSKEYLTRLQALFDSATTKVRLPDGVDRTAAGKSAYLVYRRNAPGSATSR